MAKSFKEEFEGFIKVTENFYIKQCEAAPTSYDVYQLKDSKNKKRHPFGKMDDVAYGCSLSRALELIAHSEAAIEAENIEQLANSIRKHENEFLESVNKIIKQLSI